MIELNLPYHNKRNAKIDTLVLHCLAYDVDEGIETAVIIANAMAVSTTVMGSLPASISFTPSIAGLKIAEFVLKDMLNLNS